MKINIKKSTKNYNINIENNNKIFKFDYIQFINLLYKGEELEEIIFNDEIDDEEKKQISDMINEINDVVRTESKNQN